MLLDYTGEILQYQKQNTGKGLPVGDDPSGYVGQITLSGSNKSNMLSCIGKGNNLIINDYRLDNLSIVCLDIRPFGSVCL